MILSLFLLGGCSPFGLLTAWSRVGKITAMTACSRACIIAACSHFGIELAAVPPSSQCTATMDSWSLIQQHQQIMLGLLSKGKGEVAKEASVRAARVLLTRASLMATVL